VAKRFVEDLIACIKRQWGEQPTGSEEMGKIINDFHVKRLTNLLDTSGGQVVYGGRVNAEARHI
jgi:aldehyde dehydrogenase (NAD+)